MLARIGVIALNTYREAVRARILHGLFGLSVATAGYSLIVGEFALRSAPRVVSNLGAASLSIYGIVVAVVLGATSLYRELELKTLFPILARPIHRTEYLVGKYLGILLTLLVFAAANAGILLIAIGGMSGRPASVVLGIPVVLTVATLGVAFRAARFRTYAPIPWAAALLVVGLVASTGAPDERRVLLGAAVLSLSEVAIVLAVAMVFSSFSSPFLTAMFTFGVFVVGRSADTLAKLPARIFGEAIHDAAVVLSKIVPNLMVYFPPRSLLTGESGTVDVAEYVTFAILHALAWSVGLLAVASFLFRRRDFL
jgi:ABC-type transport system involved in multi-copper enzyme maturation permease subunit